MNIEINLLPEELRPRPPVETRSMLLILLVVALIAGCAFLYMAKSNADDERERLTQQISTINQEVQALTNNQEAQALIKSLSALEAVERNYSSFLASRIDWGDALETMYSDVVQGIDLKKLTQEGSTLIIDGTASGYRAVASYGRILDQEGMFTLVGVPSIAGSAFSMVLAVEAGGGA